MTTNPINSASDTHALAMRMREAHSRSLYKLGEEIQERVTDAFFDILEGMQVTFPGESPEEQEENAEDFIALMTNTFFSDLANGE